MVSFGLAASPSPQVGAAFPIAGYLPPSLTPRRMPALRHDLDREALIASKGTLRPPLVHGKAQVMPADLPHREALLRKDLNVVGGAGVATRRRRGWVPHRSRYPLSCRQHLRRCCPRWRGSRRGRDHQRCHPVAPASLVPRTSPRRRVGQRRRTSLALRANPRRRSAHALRRCSASSRCRPHHRRLPAGERRSLRAPAHPRLGLPAAPRKRRPCTRRLPHRPPWQ